MASSKFYYTLDPELYAELHRQFPPSFPNRRRSHCTECLVEFESCVGGDVKRKTKFCPSACRERDGHAEPDWNEVRVGVISFTRTSLTLNLKP